MSELNKLPFNDSAEAVYFPEPFDPHPMDHDTRADDLQMKGRKPRQPTINKANEIVGWGTYIVTNDLGYTTE